MSVLLPDEFSQEAVSSERVQVQLGAVENRGAVEENGFLIDNAIVLPRQTNARSQFDTKDWGDSARMGSLLPGELGQLRDGICLRECR